MRWCRRRIALERFRVGGLRYTPNMVARSTLQLSAEHATFIQGGVAIDLAARDHRNMPRVARAIACRVAPDRRRLAVVFANRMIDRFVESLQGTKMIAAVFCLPSTHRAVQIKGSDARIEPTIGSDAALVERTIASFAADIMKFGFSEEYARMEMAYRPEELIAVTFTPDAVYEQTPGPQAGKRI
jgi:hypothetical protein